MYKINILICLFCTVYATNADGDTTDGSKSQTFDRNNPLNLTTNKVILYPNEGRIDDIYQSEHEVKNLLVPFFGYTIDDHPFSGIHVHPPIYFNLHEKGENLGQYVVINKALHKINDGRDSTADYPIYNHELDTNVYIATSDGIHVYDTDTRTVKKYGSLTEDILAIDKVSGEDVLYILTTDNRVYKVTENGTSKALVEGIEYAKDFVIDFYGHIYFSGEDNKPRVLLKDATASQEFKEFNFDIVNPILARPVFNPMVSPAGAQGIMYMVDGVPYVLIGNKSVITPYMYTVPGLSAFSIECSFVNFYAVNGKVYAHYVTAPSRDPNKKTNIEKQSDQ